MTDVSLHHASASSVLKHISVCLTKHSSCDTRADFFPDAYCMPQLLLPASFHLEEPKHQKLATWIGIFCLALCLTLLCSFLTQCIITGL